MTDLPQGRDGTRSVAALAVHLSTLRQEIEALAIKVDTLARTQQAQAAQSADIRELRHQVEQILATIAGGEAKEREPTWFWLTLTEQERDARFSELHDWVETVLRVQYPGYVTGQIRPCWPNHPEARWELAWLYHLWSRAYLGDRPDPRDAADWHDRWMPGVTRRIGQATSGCDRQCRGSG